MDYADVNPLPIPAHIFRVLRYRLPSSTIYLSEEIHKPFALSRVFLLFSGRKSILLVKEKAPSRSGFPLSTHVVLKTMHANPNIHVRRYYIHVRSPNLSTTRPQLLSLRKATVSIVVCGMKHYCLRCNPSATRGK